MYDILEQIIGTGSDTFIRTAAVVVTIVIVAEVLSWIGKVFRGLIRF